MVGFENEMTKVLHSPFNVEVHKATFVNYLEIVILEDGTIEYAVPSHQEKLISLACKKIGVDRDTLYGLCPREYWCDVMTWLSIQTSAIAVWDFKIEGTPNEKQLETLDMLRKEGLYKGK